MDLSKLDKKYLWHPYTQMKDWQDLDVKVIKKGRGPWLIDSEGRKYLDGVASMWCNVWGHTRREIVRAMGDQIAQLQHSTLFGLANEPSIILARMLTKRAGGMSRVFYSDNGSTAVEVALKMALQYWRNLGMTQKNTFVALKNGYHGDTVGAMSVGYIKNFFASYRRMLFPVRWAPSPYLYRRPAKMSEEEFVDHCIDSTERMLRDGSKRVAGVIMESGAQVAGGAIIYPKGYQKEIKRLCEKYDTLLILDEVATGFGRLGSMTEYLEQRSLPDIVVFGKMLTAGYLPLAVTLATDRVYRAFLGKYEEQKHLFHGHTFTGNPVACATAIANLRLYGRERLLQSVRRRSRIMQKRLDEEIRNLRIVGDVRQKGMLAGIELVKDRRSRAPLSVIGRQRINYLIMQESLKRGVFLRPMGHIMLLVPPLAISSEEMDRLIDVAADTIREVQRRIM
ncbi:MAG: adenosylmethionine--8-amino-7-oxononanoate transaminase [Nitrososphaerales archaeon]